MSKLISIIVNCYNGEKYLKQTLESIQKQNYTNWELIFWDNQSTDNSKVIFDSFNESRFKYFYSEKFTSLYEARNLACRKCNGEFIAFLDCDDWWYDNFLSERESFFLISNLNFHIQNFTIFFKKVINSKLITKTSYPTVKYMIFYLKIIR